MKYKSFGSQFTDYMFIMEWNEQQGWHNKRLQPYESFQLDPASANLHYGQEIFEGMKAFATIDNRIVLFRPRNNLWRMNNSTRIMCMPEIDVEETLTWLIQLIKQDKQWVPTERGTALYIRPTMIASQKTLNLKPATEFIFFIILSPVGALYEHGFNCIPILVTEKYTRASAGGVGQAKAAGNYAASMRAQKEAQAAGCAQVLWLDPIERKYIEEVGAMNIFFVIDGMVVTPSLTDSILPGITRLSILELCKAHDIPFQERRLTIDEIIAGIQRGLITEIFGSGTAAVITPVGSLRYHDMVYTVNNNQTGFVTQKLFKLLTDIQYGISEDTHNWLELVQDLRINSSNIAI